MNLCLRLKTAQCLHQRIDLEQLAVAGGASDSIFPLVEAWLQQSTDHWNSLRAIAGRKRDPGFRSVVDFIVASVFPELRAPCARFYAGRGPALRELVSEARRSYIERRALLFLEVAYAAFSEKRRASWSWALGLVRRLEAA